MKIFLLISIAYSEEKNRILTKSVRGLFSSLDLAVDSLTEYPDSITEGNYFNYVLIEEREGNVLDAHSIDEHWFRFLPLPGDMIMVERIACPEPFTSYSNFV